ncbi:carbohydrate esterase family 3 protein [Xylariaceae sp. FL1651]|nr:carbohydrate esterase family 3 protein [Xylariaceae sp. FL1651]
MVAIKLFPLAILAGAAVAQNVTLRYMPFGDSITEIICWRAMLWEKMQSTEFASVNWVGSGKTDEGNCADTKYDHDHEGHSGFLAINIANNKQLVGWLQNNPADVITMHLGTNDIVQQNKPTDQILAAFTTLVGVMRASNPNMKIIVAQIIPIGIGNYNGAVQALNKAIPAWAQGLNKTESPIWVVDQFTGMSSSDLRDGIHPNKAGDTKMANVWYPALMNAMRVAKADKLAAADAKVELPFTA